MNNLSKVFCDQEPQLDPGFLTKTSQIQLFYGIWVNMVQFAIGLAFGFASVAIPKLSRPDSEIKITVVDSSWIVSSVALMIPVGCVISGFMMDSAGRRHTLICCQVPMFVGWLYTALAETATDIIIARALTGVGCGMAMAPSRAYGTEIALPNMRGVIGALPSLAISLGITITAALGKFLSWQHLCYFCCGFTFLNFCSFIVLPETPYFILQTGTELEAQANLALFRAKNYNTKKEMAQLKDFKEENNLSDLSLRDCLGLLLSKASCKPFTLIMIYQLITQAAGVSILLFWTIDLLQKTKLSFDVETGNILIGVARIFSGITTSILLYRFGRRPLALISAIGVTIVCCTFGLTLMAKIKPSMSPQIFLMTYVVFASLGYYTLPFLMAFELYPLQVRGILGGATISITSLMMFVSTKMEPFMLDSLGVSNTFLAFGLFSFIGCVFIFFWLPETKDLTLQEIEEYYKDIRPTLASQRRIKQSMSLLAELSRGGRQSLTNVKLERVNRQSTSKLKHAQLEAQKKLAELIGKEIEEQLKLSTSGTDVRSTQEREKRTNRGSVKSKESKKSTLGVIYEKDEKKIDKNTSFFSSFFSSKDEKSDEETPKDKKGTHRDSVKSTESKNATLGVNIEKDKNTSFSSKDEKSDEETIKDKKNDDYTLIDEDQPSTSKKNTQ